MVFRGTDATRQKVPRTGRILVDKPDGNVVQMELQSAGGPVEPGGRTRWVLSWGDVKIGEVTYLLPVAEDGTWHNGSAGDTWHVTVKYKNHRHFEAATSVKFHEETAPSKEVGFEELVKATMIHLARGPILYAQMVFSGHFTGLSPAGGDLSA